jgi:hypothetical protein
MKRFEIITEADARTIDIGATVELTAGGHVTPLARDTLAARRVTVVRVGSLDESIPGDLAPTSDIRRVAIGSDHTGLSTSALVNHLRGRWLCRRGNRHDRPVDYRYCRCGRASGEENQTRESPSTVPALIGDRGEQGPEARRDVRDKPSRGTRASTTARTC